MFAVEEANSSLPSTVEKTSEHVLHPPQPPNATRIFNFGYLFFRLTK